jgi:hypothetical protein
MMRRGGLGDDVECEVAACFDPLIEVFDQDGSD